MVKLHITPQELQMLQQTDLFLFKRQFFDKLGQAFGHWQQEAMQQPSWKQIELPISMERYSAKISRGENYYGLPWMMADMPRHFGKHDVAAFRLFFWWGNYFSATWHLKGKPLKTWWPGIRHWLSRGDMDIWLSWEGDEWNHVIKSPWYIPSSIAKITETDSSPQWCKISIQMDLDTDWHARSMHHFKALLSAVDYPPMRL